MKKNFILRKFLFFAILLFFSIAKFQAQCTNDNGLNEYPNVAPKVNGNSYDFSAIGGSTVMNGTTFNTPYLEYQVGPSQNFTGTRQRIDLPSIPSIDNKAREFVVYYGTREDTWDCYLTIFYNYVDGGPKYVALSSKVVNKTDKESRFIIPAGVNRFFVQLHKKTDCSGDGNGFGGRIITLSYIGVAISSNKAITNPSGCPTSTQPQNGKIELNPTDGTAPYTYTWTSSVSGFTSPATNSNFIDNLKEGSYTCTIKDSSNPQKEITENYTLTTAYTSYDAYIKTDATCGNYNLTLDPIAGQIVKRDFNQSGGFSLVGDAVLDNNNVMLVPNQSNKSGKLILNDLPAILPSDFEVNYQFYMQAKDGADGYSFNLGTDNFAGANEDGVTQGLAVKFKIYGQDKVSVAWNGTEFVAPFNLMLELGRWVDVKVKVVGGKLTLYVNGIKIANEVTIPGYAQDNSYKLIFAARAGGVSNEVRIDDVYFGNPNFEYSIDGNNFQSSPIFTNITLPANRTLPIWMKQNGCAAKVRDFVYPEVIAAGINVNNQEDPNGITLKTNGCNPTNLIVTGPRNSYNAYQNFNFTGKGTAYLNNFTTKDGYIFGGSAVKSTNGILLTRNAPDNNGYLIVNKPESIEKDFEIAVIHKALNQSGADGFSISFGDPSAIVNQTVSYENGVSTGLAVRFKTYGQDNVSVFYNGVQVGSTFNNAGFNMETGNAADYRVKVVGNTVEVKQNSSVLVSATLPDSYTTDSFSGFQFIVAARTGGSYNENLIERVSILENRTLQASTDNINFTDLSTTGETNVPLTASSIINSTTTNVYLKYKTGCATVRIVKGIEAKFGPAQANVQDQTLYGSNITGANIVASAPNSNTTMSLYNKSDNTQVTSATALPVGIYNLTAKTVWNDGRNNCESFKDFKVEVKPLLAPVGKSIQIYTGNNATIGNLTANVTEGGTNLQWYDAATGGNLLTSSSPITDGGNYYAQQTVAGNDTPRLKVTAKRISDNPVNVCNATSTLDYATLTQNYAAPAASTSVQWLADNSPATVAYKGTDLVTSGTKYVRLKDDNQISSSTITPAFGYGPVSSFQYIIAGEYSKAITSNGNGIADGAYAVYYQGQNPGMYIKSCYKYASYTTYFLATSGQVTNTSKYQMRRGLQSIAGPNAYPTYSSNEYTIRLNDINGAIVDDIKHLYVGTDFYVLLADKTLRKLSFPTTPEYTAFAGDAILSNVDVFKFVNNGKICIGETNAIKVYKTSDYSTPILTINNTGKVIDVTMDDTGNVFAIVQNADNSYDMVSYDMFGNDKIVLEYATPVRFVENSGSGVAWPADNATSTINIMERPKLSNKIPVTVNLAAPLDTTITNSSGTLSVAQTTGATYQWLKCDGNDISGATNNTYAPTEVGSYQVRVTKDGCSSTSTCYSLSTLSTQSLEKLEAKVYPNPTTGIVNINSLENTEVQVFDISGKLVQSQKVSKGTSTIDLTSKNAGVYLIKIGKQTYKVIKK